MFMYVMKKTKKRATMQKTNVAAAATAADGTVLASQLASWGADDDYIIHIDKIVCACGREQGKGRHTHTSGYSDGSDITTRRKSGKHYRNTSNKKKNDKTTNTAATAKLTNWLNER